MKVKKWLFVGALSSILLVGACGNTKKEDAGKAEKPKEPVEEVEQTEPEEIEEKTEPEAEEVKDDGEMLNPHIAEETDGDVEIITTNKKPELKHAYSDDVTIEIDEYQVVHISDMNESMKVSFADQDEGYVLTYKYTLDNQSDEDVYFNLGAMLYSDDAIDHLPVRGHFVARDEWMNDESNDAVNQYSKGKSFSGMEAHMITKEQFKKLEAPKLTISKPYLNDDTSKTFGEEAVFFLPFTDKGAEKATATADLYQDKMVTDSVADKELFFAKEDIDVTESIDDVKITLEGVQYANITPTAGHADRFSNFGEGPLVALTLKFNVENGSDKLVSKTSTGIKLNLDQNRGTMLSNGMLEPTVRGEIEPGESHEVLSVFLFREDEFNLYKELEIEFGPLTDEKVQKLFKEKFVTFDIPMK